MDTQRKRKRTRTVIHLFICLFVEVLLLIVLNEWNVQVLSGLRGHVTD